MEIKMLKEEDRIFKNLYNNLGWEINHAIEREDWSNTKEIISKIRKFILDNKLDTEIKNTIENLYQEANNCIQTIDFQSNELVNFVNKIKTRNN